MQTHHESSIPAAISGLDLSRVVSKLKANTPVVSGESMDVDRALLDYQRFLTLRLLHPDQTLVPTGMIDEFWHQHILDTRAYAEDCMSVFGGFMDHDPDWGAGSEEEAEKNAEAFDVTRRLYSERFGEDMAGVPHRCSSKDCRGGGRSLPIRR